MRPASSVYPIEKIISALSYLTAGMAGFIWLCIAALLKKSVRSFLMFNIMQSIFLSIAYYIFIQLYKLIFIVLVKIPIINALAFFINQFIFAPLPIFWGMSLLQIFTTGVIIYLVSTSLLGVYSYIPWVSNIIRGNTDR